MRYGLVISLTAVAAVLSACEEDPVGPAAECTDDTGTVTVSVSDATQPVITWDPPCAVALLLIEEDASDRWGISTDDSEWDDPSRANLIEPPVTYGVAPSGVSEWEAPAALLAGTTYEVILYRVLTTESTATCLGRIEQVCLLALHEFVP